MKKIMLLFTITAAAFLQAKTDISGNASAYLSAGWNDNLYYRKAMQINLQFDASSENTIFKTIIRADDDTAKSNIRSIGIYEAYISQDFYFSKLLNSLNIKLGKLIYTWGNADELKPADILNHQDYTYLSFKNLKDRKIGNWSIDCSLYLTDNIFFEAVFLPIFQKSDFSSSVFSFELPLNNAAVPDNAVSNSSYAGRLGLTLFSIDMHFIYYSGYDSVPSVKTALSLPAYNTVSIPIYQRIEMYGFDFQRALFSEISVRGEAAYFDCGKQFTLKTNSGLLSPFFQDLLAGGSGLISKKLVDYTVGFDINNFPVKNFYFNIQFNQNYILDWINSIQQNETVNLLAFDAEYALFTQKMKLKSRGYYDLQEYNYGINFESTIKISGNYSADIGAWIFDGKDTSYYGLLKEKDFCYIKGKIYF